MKPMVTTFPDLLERVNLLIRELGEADLSINPTSRFGAYQLELAKAVRSRSAPNANQLKRWHRLLIEVNDLSMIQHELSRPPAVFGWERRTREVLSGSFFRSSDGKNTHARNTQFELVVAAALRSAGYELELEEPDIVVEMAVGQVGIAAKRPASQRNLTKTIRDAGRQIAAQNKPGIIALDATVLVAPDDGEITTDDFAASESRVAVHAIAVAKHLAAIAGLRVGTEHVFGLLARVCVPTWEPHLLRLSYVERWPIVCLVNESDTRFRSCFDLATSLQNAR